MREGMKQGKNAGIGRRNSEGKRSGNGKGQYESS
jgi:hypothetical protein